MGGGVSAAAGTAARRPARCRAYWAAHRERRTDAKAAAGAAGLVAQGDRGGGEIPYRGQRLDARSPDQGHRSACRRRGVGNRGPASVRRRLRAPPRATADRAVVGLHPHPGRARSHTKATPVWETYRLVGTLDGHLATYRHPAAAGRGEHRGPRLQAGRRAPRCWPSRPASRPRCGPVRGSWADHDGALAVVFTGLPGGDVVLPVRLPQGAGQWAHLCHFLADPAVWHKIDLVRVRDRKAPGGWRYYAHLLTHQPGYQSAATRARRAADPHRRRAGVDANVSNLAVASFPAGIPSSWLSRRSPAPRTNSRLRREAARRARARQRALDRSRRNTNPDQYGPSARQAARAARRAERRIGTLSSSPIRAGPGMGASMVRRCGPTATTNSRAATTAPGPIMPPTPVLPVRPNTPAPTRSRRGSWPPTAPLSPSKTPRSRPGRGCGASGSPCSAPACSSPPLAAECAATGGRLYRAGTRSTALSQHCLCGARVPKTLAQRTHYCPACGLRADRDVTSAVLAACVDLADPDDPRSARVDYTLAHALRAGLASQQEWEGSVNRHQPPTPHDGAGSARAGSHHLVASAEQAALGPPPNRPGTPGRRGASRKEQHPKLFGAA